MFHSRKFKVKYDYNKLFDGNVSLELLNEEIDIPLDLLKIIVDYSHLSIYDPDDVSLVFNKITRES
jgi:hypothetical protein